MIIDDTDELLDLCKDAQCSDGNCCFKIFPEQRLGQHTNGRCKCLEGLPIETKRTIRTIFNTLRTQKKRDTNVN
jgi:hypothetical protein